MSGTDETVFSGVLEQRGAERRIEGHVTGCVASGNSLRFAFATAEGDVLVADRGDVRHAHAWTVSAVHDGPALCIAADISPDGFLTGGEDGRLCRIGSTGVTELAKSRRWIEHVASWAEGRSPVIAFAAGKQVELRDGNGTLLRTLDHPSTVSGIAFDGKGKRLAASHYNGASLWFVQSRDSKPRVLEWKGSHTGIAIHPGGDALVTTMQENELHGWRLADGHNMRMSGYPSKVQSMAFTRTGKWLATSGADSVVMWPFFGGGPIGKPPYETAGISGVLCTQIATHPKQDVLAAGFADGSVLLIEYSSERVLPVCAAGGGPVSALAFSPDGCLMGFGTEQGRVGLVDLSDKG